MPQPPTVPLDDNGVEIQSPVVNKHHSAPSDGLTVAGEAGVNVMRVWVKIIRSSDSPPADPSAAGWDSVVPSAGQFSIAVPGTMTTPLIGSTNNKAVAIPELASGYGEPDAVYFIGRPMRENISVSARSCIWFTFADSDLSGPGDEGDTEGDTDDHRPVEVVVPINASTMSTSAFGTWRHFYPNGGDPASCDADGKEPSTNLEDNGYRNVTYASESIDDFSELVGSLVGMWVDTVGSPVNPCFRIGANSSTTIPVQSPPVDKVYYAFHDGKRWHNNSGEVANTIDWTVALGRLALRM